MNDDDAQGGFVFAGKEVKKLRKLAGISQRKLAELMDTTTMTVSRIERDANRASPQTLLLARLIGDPRFRAEWLQRLPKRK